MAGTIYYSILSRYARFAYTVALATGTAEGKVIDMSKGEHKSEEFIKVNPFGQVPAYKDDKVSLYESSAIVRYLINISKSDLLPFDDPVQFALIDVAFEKLRSTITTAVDSAVGGIFFGKLFGNPVSEEAAQNLIKAVDDKFELIESNFFKESAYVTGTKLSVADLLLLSAIQHLKLIGYGVEKYQKVTKFYETVSSLDYVKTVEAEFNGTLAYFQSH